MISVNHMNREKTIAQALLKIKAVGFKPAAPITFKSGIKSPVYVDNRKFPYHPHEWHDVIEGFREIIAADSIPCDVIAGVEAGGIPHSAALGFLMEKPSIFVRKKPKDHGTKSRIEGGDVKGKSVILVEDLVTTGGSSLASVDALREEGASVTDCVVIVSYGFAEANKSFADAGVRLHPLTSFPVILEEALAQGILKKDDAERVGEWFKDPHGWAAKYGFI